MAIPMCEGKRHVFIVGRELCRCGQASSLALDPRETRIAGLVTRETRPQIQVMFVMGPEGAISAIVQCAECDWQYPPPLPIAAKLWRRMAAPSSEAKQAQRQIADQLVQIARASTCECDDGDRGAKMWGRQGTKALLS